MGCTSDAPPPSGPLVHEFENALARTLVAEAYRELLQAPNSEAKTDVAHSHLARIERSVNPKLLTPEVKLILSELAATLNHEISLGKLKSNLDRLNPRTALVTTFSHQFVAPMPNSKDDLTKIVAGTKEFSALLTKEIGSRKVESDPVAVKAVINALKNLADGAAPIADYQYRVRSLELPTKEANSLNSAYRTLYASMVVPQIEVLLDKLKDQKPQRESVLTLPDGNEYYEIRIRQASGLRADEVHTLGLNELGRLQRRIEDVSGVPARNVFRDTRDNPDNYFQDNDTGRHEYLNEVYGVIENVAAQVDVSLQSLTVKAVDPYRSKYATAFDYFGATLHINLSDMKDLPRYELSGQVRFHSMPGLHLANERGGSTGSQISFSSYLAADPDTEKLNTLMYLVDSTSLMIIDTGIHALGWSEQQAIDFMTENTALPNARILQYVDEVYMEPGRWVPPAVGRLRIHQLAKRHGVDFVAMSKILMSLGPQPIAVLDQYLTESQSGYGEDSGRRSPAVTVRPSAAIGSR